MKTARISGGELFGPGSAYTCQKPWPDECGVQGGTSGIVFTKPTLSQAIEQPVETVASVVAAKASPEPEGPGYYKTAFFEAFPKAPSCFLRGEGATVEEAEANCWQKFERVLACQGHDFERRNRRDGYAFCRHCNLSGMYLTPLENCLICGVATHYVSDTDGKFYCEEHEFSIPEDKVPAHTRRLREMMENLEKRQAEEAAREKELGIVWFGNLPVSTRVTAFPFVFRVVLSAEPGDQGAEFDALVATLSGKQTPAEPEKSGTRTVTIDLGFGVELTERQVSRVGLGAKAYFDHVNPAWNTQIVSTEQLPESPCR